MSREIKMEGNPILRQIAEEIPLNEIQREETQRLIDDLIQLKRKAEGAGLAANQIGIPKRVFIVEVLNNKRYPYKPNYPLTIVINPKIVFLTKDRFQNYEGCLSIPDLRGMVERCPIIRVTGYDRNSKELDFIVKGITAGSFQHENDHLNGKLFIDLVSNKSTLVSWREFDANHKRAFEKYIQKIEKEYG